MRRSRSPLRLVLPHAKQKLPVKPPAQGEPNRRLREEVARWRDRAQQAIIALMLDNNWIDPAGKA